MMKRISAFFADTARVFQTPFIGLSFVMGCYFVLSYFASIHHPVWHGDLPDPDDYTYLSQTLDWLQGQNWFDNVQHRMNPPAGVAIHYTRIAEMPIAGMIMLFRLFHYSWGGAATLGSLLLPIIYLGGLFTALRRTAEKFIAPEWTRLTSFIVMFAPILMFKFAPGQVDHHGLEAILTIIAIGLVAQMFARPDQTRWAAGAGIVSALTTAIALEVLPWMTLTAAVVGLWTVVSGRKASRSSGTLGLTLFAFGALFLALEKSPADILQPDLLSYSVAYVVLEGGIALALLGAAGTSFIDNVKLRLAVSGCISVALGAVYLHHFPALLGGPYGAMDPRLAAMFFANLEEAVPLVERFGALKVLLHIVPPVMALVASLYFMLKGKDHKKWSWFLLAALLGTSIALALFYQIRVMVYVQAFAVIPLTAWVMQGWRWIGAHYRERRKFWAEIGLVLLVGPLTAVFLPALQDSRAFNTGVLLFPAQSYDDSCEMSSLERLLNTPLYAARAPLRIVGTIDQGPELLFRTPHAVLSAPYHTNVSGNLDALALLSTTDSAEAEKIARRDGVNLIALCRNVPDMYLNGSGPHYVAMADGQVGMLPDPSLAGQLVYHHIPDWLTEIPVPSPSNFLLFEVK
jgi:hypothetical protein